VASFYFTSGLMAFTSRQLCGLLLRPLAVIEVELHMAREPSLIGRIWALPNAVRQTQTYPNPNEDFVFTAVDPFVDLQLPYHLQQQGHRSPRFVDSSTSVPLRTKVSCRLLQQPAMFHWIRMLRWFSVEPRRPTS
jgi:hypothetical protein